MSKLERRKQRIEADCRKERELLAYRQANLFTSDHRTNIAAIPYTKFEG